MQNFINLYHHQQDFNMNAGWIFFATIHGKSLCNGVGGFVKHYVAKCSLRKPLQDQILSYQSMLHLCVWEITSITFFGESQEEMVNVCADLKDHFVKSKTMPGTRSSHHFVTISCNKIAHKLLHEDRVSLIWFQQIIDWRNSYKNIKCFSYVSCIYDTFWWVCIVTEVNMHEADLKIEFFHQYGLRDTFCWPSVADNCFVPVSNILCIITAPTTIT